MLLKKGSYQILSLFQLVHSVIHAVRLSFFQSVLRALISHRHDKDVSLIYRYEWNRKLIMELSLQSSYGAASV